MVSPRARREQVRFLGQRGVSQRRACGLLGVPRSPLAYRLRQPERQHRHRRPRCLLSALTKWLCGNSLVEGHVLATEPDAEGACDRARAEIPTRTAHRAMTAGTLKPIQQDVLGLLVYLDKLAVLQ